MALTQMQIIQSLGESMAWFERELQWGVPPTELRHLIGRIGELYAALITNGQMALDVNQHGYDVVSDLGERISVKTTAISGTAGHISFNRSTLDQVDRIIVLRVNTEEMQIELLLDQPVSEAEKLMAEGATDKKLSISLSKLLRAPKSTSEIKRIRSASFGEYLIQELENGAIEVLQDGVAIQPVKPVLRQIASELKIGTLNDNGNPHNTRRLGSNVLSALEQD